MRRRADRVSPQARRSSAPAKSAAGCKANHQLCRSRRGLPGRSAPRLSRTLRTAALRQVLSNRRLLFDNLNRTPESALFRICPAFKARKPQAGFCGPTALRSRKPDQTGRGLFLPSPACGRGAGVRGCQARIRKPDSPSRRGAGLEQRQPSGISAVSRETQTRAKLTPRQSRHACANHPHTVKSSVDMPATARNWPGLRSCESLGDLKSIIRSSRWKPGPGLSLVQAEGVISGARLVLGCARKRAV